MAAEHTMPVAFGGLVHWDEGTHVARHAIIRIVSLQEFIENLHWDIDRVMAHLPHRVLEMAGLLRSRVFSVFRPNLNPPLRLRVQ
jgi:hypothetical protein